MSLTHCLLLVCPLLCCSIPYDQLITMGPDLNLRSQISGKSNGTAGDNCQVTGQITSHLRDLVALCAILLINKILITL
jgi:hypothetical protein